MTPTPEQLREERKAEHVLSDEGVFLGHQGLRGLLEADQFWDSQPYGTRLYYGGGQQYLHRDVLRAAIRALDKMAKLPSAEAELARLKAPIADGEVAGIVAWLTERIEHLESMDRGESDNGIMATIRFEECDYLRKNRAALESLSAQLASREEEIRALKDKFIAKECGRFMDDAPGARGECGKKWAAGRPCKECPSAYPEEKK